MTIREFNRAVEDIEITMLDMTPNDRYEILLNCALDRCQLTGPVQIITDLLTLLPRLNDSYVHFILCRAICNLLYI